MQTFTFIKGALVASAHQTDLAKGISIVSRAVAGRSTLPVLGNIFVATDQGRLRLAATNLELSIACWIDSTVETEGATTLPAKTVVDLVNSLPAQNAVLRLTERTQTTALTCGRVKANIKGIAPDEFPVILDLDPATALSADAAQWKAGVSRVIVASATDEARPIMTGLLLVIAEGKATLAASDGFRLALDIREGQAQPEQVLTAIIPARALAELNRVIDPEQPLLIDFKADRGQITFKSGDVQLTSQLIEGAFPEYSAIIPKRIVTRTILNTAELRKLLKSVDVISREVAHTARFAIRPGEGEAPGTLKVTASSAETGDNTAEMDVIVEGPAIDIAFNVSFFLDGLAGIDTPTVSLETTTSTGPGLLKPMGADGFSYTIMPMAIGN